MTEPMPENLDEDGQSIWRRCEWILNGGPVDASASLQLQALALRRELRLESENSQLRQWKREAIIVLAGYDEIAEMVGGALGSSKIENLRAFVTKALRATP